MRSCAHEHDDWSRRGRGDPRAARLAQEHGGREAVAAQHAQGRLAIRERIDALLDAGSFREQGPIAGASELGDDGALRAFTPANYVLGTGRIDGRPCVVGGEDFTQRGGSPSPAGLRKSVFAEDLCLRLRVPLVRLLQGAGGSVTAADGKSPKRSAGEGAATRAARTASRRSPTRWPRCRSRRPRSARSRDCPRRGWSPRTSR